MSRRQEIKEKEALQARFQHAMTQNSKLALNWLRPNQAVNNTKNTPAAPSSQGLTAAHANQFFDLPVVAQGASLSELSVAKLGRTVGQFVKGTTPAKPHAVTKPRKLKAMQALLNKMRDDKRSQLNQRASAKPSYSSKPSRPLVLASKANNGNNNNDDDDDSDSDSDGEAKRKFTAKKVVSKRPF